MRDTGTHEGLAAERCEVVRRLGVQHLVHTDPLVFGLEPQTDYQVQNLADDERADEREADDGCTRNDLELHEVPATAVEHAVNADARRLGAEQPDQQRTGDTTDKVDGNNVKGVV